MNKEKKVRELGIFQNMVVLENNDGITMLHQDDMPTYNSWFLTTCHDVDKIIYRGKAENAPSELNISEKLKAINNPKNILITYSKKDTY